jgi:hypothetical protein
VSTFYNLLFVTQECGFGLNGVLGGSPYLWTELAEKVCRPSQKHKPLCSVYDSS